MDTQDPRSRRFRNLSFGVIISLGSIVVVMVVLAAVAASMGGSLNASVLGALVSIGLITFLLMIGVASVFPTSTQDRSPARPAKSAELEALEAQIKKLKADASKPLVEFVSTAIDLAVERERVESVIVTEQMNQASKYAILFAQVSILAPILALGIYLFEFTLWNTRIAEPWMGGGQQGEPFPYTKDWRVLVSGGSISLVCLTAATLLNQVVRAQSGRRESIQQEMSRYAAISTAVTLAGQRGDDKTVETTDRVIQGLIENAFTRQTRSPEREDASDLEEREVLAALDLRLLMTKIDKLATELAKRGV
ncbi:MAG: hypothetical protein ACIAQU_06205 [Phycisphaerales bacterium JB064]